MDGPASVDFPSSYANSIGRISLRPFGGTAAAVRYLEMLVAQRTDQAPELVVVSEDLALATAVKTDEGSVLLTTRMLDAWGVTAEQIVEDQISEIPELALDVRTLTKNTFVVHSELFAGAVWQSPQLVNHLDTRGTPLIWPVGDGMTLVTGDHSVDDLLSAIAALIERIQSGAELETLFPHRLIDGAWVSSDWPASVDDAVRPLERLFARHWYELQRESLLAYFKQQGYEMNVPEYRVTEDDEGNTIAGCECVAGVANLIPAVDVVVVTGPDGSITAYTSEEFANKSSTPFEEMEVTPPRWLTYGDL